MSLLTRRLIATATLFIKTKIMNIVKEFNTKRRLIPTEPYTRASYLHDGYYEVVNEPNV
jgi:cyclohexanone monooxygenase